MNSLELRKKFFDFFIRHGHQKITSSSLIPAQDPTLLFTNAGMNQFKDLFLGKEHRSYKRAVTIQKCVRAGGKHNDLDNVGFTQRHLTFFEMMGNFSFGDYFKKEAIRYAWDFLTIDIAFPIADLYVTVHHSDDESFTIWHEEIGVPKHKIFRLGEDNFWQMGDVGPCGPCTEIFVDRGDGFGCGKKDCSPACGCDRFIEVWNNVFMQFEKKADGTQVALTQTGVDTGMGLERLAMLVQKRESVFDTDVFRPIFNEIERITGLTYSSSSFEIKAAFNVLGDHIRSATMLINDGCAPSNEGRGYVLRKIIRRAALFSQKLTNKTIFPKLAAVVAETMKEVYPEVMQHKERIISVLESEVEKFSDNLVRGQKIMQEYIQKAALKTISGEQAFALYDTYGFPLEVTELIAKTHGFLVDKEGFDAYMQEQKIRSGKKMKMAAAAFEIPATIHTEFTGYSSLCENSSVIGIVAQDALVTSVKKGTECWIIAEKTPFFVACGGQVNDQGTVIIGNASAPLLDLKKIDDAILIKIVAPHDIKIGDKVTQQVSEYSRLHTMKNHTATHLLQAALQNHFGKQVKQAGSVVTPDYLRFDYTYHKPLTEDEIASIERLVNEKIWENISVSVMHCSYQEALEKDVMAIFGEKYNPESVRAILIDDFSRELCGGTHVRATGDIGMFKIIEDSALAAGQRRIVAYTGGKALSEFQSDFSIIKKLQQTLKTKSDAIILITEQLLEKQRDMQKQIQVLKKELLFQKIPQWLHEVERVRGVSTLLIKMQDDIDIRDLALTLQKQGVECCMIVHDAQKASFIITVSDSISARVDLKGIQQDIKQQWGLQGGLNRTIIQGGGSLLKDFSQSDWRALCEKYIE